MERKQARKLYRWLWWSPLITVPTLAFLMISDFFWPVSGIVCRDCSYASRYGFTIVISVILSSFWHLNLLIPALNKESEFVRWHSRQALILAGVRTVVPIFLVLLVDDELGVLYSIPFLFLIWLIGNIWGQGQARKGDCSLMRWFGHEDALAGPEPDLEADRGVDKEIEVLGEIIRFSQDSKERRNAQLRLEELDVVEEL